MGATPTGSVMRKSGLEIIGLGRILHYTDSARNDPRPRGGDAYKYRGTIFQHDNALCIDRYGRRLSRTNPNYRIREARPQPDADRLRPPRRARARAAPTRPVDSEHSRTRVIHPPAQRACALRPACRKACARRRPRRVRPCVRSPLINVILPGTLGCSSWV